jgi:hypothetical protein
MKYRWNFTLRETDQSPEVAGRPASRPTRRALLLGGRYLTQVRQYDLGYTALAGVITDARRAADTLTAASGVIGMCSARQESAPGR